MKDCPGATRSGYSIRGDATRGILFLEFRGFLKPTDLERYLDTKNTTLMTLRCAPNDHLTLCDLTASVPQSSEVLAILKQSLDAPAMRSRRLAVVTASALTNMQARRVFTRADVGFFDERPHALTWLLGPTPDVRA